MTTLTPLPIAQAPLLPSPVALLALELAASQIGVAENPPGSNRGPEVDRYLASVGLAPGQPWCAAFVYWCFERAAGRLGASLALQRTGSCSALYRGAKAKGLVATFPAAGDIFLVRGGPTGHKHCGMVKSFSEGWIETIEGNATAAGGAEGLAVMRRRRRAIASDYVRLRD